MIRRLLLVIGLAAAAGCPAGKHPREPIGSTAPPTKNTPYGTWREFWGEGANMLDHNDEYRVDLQGGRTVVTPLKTTDDESIVSVTIAGDSFDLILHTAFDVHYVLQLDPDGQTMTGTATTPDVVAPIRWVRIDN